jgi:tetratricopeptide (TPR) repeat protein
MNAHLDRARLLLAQSRPADAERESMFALAQQPDDPQALAILALSRVEQGKAKEALEAVRDAIAVGPDEPFLHYVHAHVLRNMDRLDDAWRAVKESLRLEPTSPDTFTMLASIELARGRWADALDAADVGLVLNPEHVGAANVRAMALVRLGRKAEAMKSVDYALNRAPENAFSHANQGWNCLHRNDPFKAQDHFREALRLDPNLEYAREGMLEALKARNPVYRIMLAYFLWLGRQSMRFQWVFIIGIFLGGRVARALSLSQPGLNWIWWPLLGLFYGFVYLSWTAQPMFNLMLRFDRFGRHVLSADQRSAANWFGGAFALALGSLACWMATDHQVALWSALVFAVLSICVSATYTRTGRDRKILGSCTAALAFLAIGAAFLSFSNNAAGHVFTFSFAIGFIAFQLVANALATRSRSSA